MPEQVSNDYSKMVKFVFQKNQWLVDNMRPNVDQWTQVFDCTNFGYANFDKGVFAAISPIMKVHCDRRYKVYVIGGGMILTGIWSML